MNSLDFFILTFILIFLIRGLFRGFVRELTTVIGLILGYLVAISYIHILTSILLEHFPTLPNSLVDILCFSALFILTNIILRLIANIITQTLKFAMLGWLNRLLGGLFGLLKSLLIMGIAVFLLNLIPFSSSFVEKAGTDNSILFPILKTIGPELYKEVQKITNPI